MKKHLSLFLAVLMLSGIFSLYGCKTDTDNSKETESSTKDSAGSSAESESKATEDTKSAETESKETETESKETETESKETETESEAPAVPPAADYTVFASDRVISVDGSLSDWYDVPKNYFSYYDFSADGKTLLPSSDAYFMMLWDEEAKGIYLSAFIPDTKMDTNAKNLRDWFSMSYHFGEKKGKLNGKFIVCTVNCDSWHPGLTNYDVNESGNATGLVDDGSESMNFTYQNDGVVIEAYMPISDKCKDLLHVGASMNVALRYDDGRKTDYTNKVERNLYLWGDDDHSLYNDLSKFGTVVFSGKTVSEHLKNDITDGVALSYIKNFSVLGLIGENEYGEQQLGNTPTEQDALALYSKLFAIGEDTAGFTADEKKPADMALWLKLISVGMGYSTAEATDEHAKSLGILPESYTENESFTFRELFWTAGRMMSAQMKDGGTNTEKLIEKEIFTVSKAVTQGMYKRKLTEEYTTSNPEDEKYEKKTVRAGTVLVTPEDFGAVGDGKTDDGPALEAAFKYLKTLGGEPSVLKFGKGKTYAVKSCNESQYLINITGQKNVQIDGQGANIRLTYPVFPMWIESSENVEVFDLDFDYDPTPFVLGKIKRVDARKGFVRFTTETEMNLGIGETWTTADSVFFALPNLEYTRGFINIYKYEREDENTYLAYSKDLSVAMAAKEWIFPNPGAAHLGTKTEAASYHIFYNKNVELANINIYSNIYFTFSVSGNLGEIRFVNVDLKAREDAEVQLVSSWRDGFHCKENRAPITWERCYIGNLGDDAFNICSTLQAIQNIKKSGGEKIYTLSGVGQYANSVLEVGDEVDAYNVVTGKYYGRSRVKEVLSQSPKKITLEDDIPGLLAAEGVRLAFVSLTAPGSVIKDCVVKGTVRFKGPITVTNTEFDILEMWEMVEGDTEGPIPRNVVFRDCLFTHGLITLDAVNRSTGKSFPAIAKEIEIRFENCKFQSEVKILEKNGATAVKEESK